MENNTTSPSSTIAPMSWQNFLATIAVGLLTGAVVWVITYTISQYLLPRFVCDANNTIMLCTQSNVFASNLATIFGALIGVLLLLKFNVFRPLLVVVVTAIALWDIENWVQGGAWYEPLLLTAALYSLSYVTFAWFARINFLRMAIIIIAVTLIAVRVVPSFF